MNMVDQPSAVELSWHGPFRLRQLLTDAQLKAQFDLPGVYIWKLSEDAINYVGRALGKPTLWHRQFAHYVATIGGLYQLPDVMCADGRHWEIDHSRADVMATLLDVSRFQRIVSGGFAYIEKADVWLCPMKDVARKTIERVERTLLHDTQPTGTRHGTQSAPPVPISMSHQNASWATPSIRVKLTALGNQFKD
jgi:hypothetical protein